MNIDEEIKKLEGTALFKDNGESISKAIRVIFKELNDERAVRGVSIHLSETDQSKVTCVEFVLLH